MAGNYNEELRLKGDPELLELADSLNDLSDVFRLTHENLAQEKNRLSSVLSYMSDGVIATNRRGQITMINSTAQRLLNLDYETATQMSIFRFIRWRKIPILIVNCCLRLLKFICLVEMPTMNL